MLTGYQSTNELVLRGGTTIFRPERDESSKLSSSRIGANLCEKGKLERVPDELDLAINCRSQRIGYPIVVF